MLRIEYADAGLVPLVAIESSLTMNAIAPTSVNRKVQIVQPATGLSLSGDSLTFVVRADPAPEFNPFSTQLQAHNGVTWVDLTPFVTGVTAAEPEVILNLDVGAAIGAGALTAGPPQPFRARVTGVDGTVVNSSNDPAAAQTGLQGLVQLTPMLAGGAMQESLVGFGAQQRLTVATADAVTTRVGPNVSLTIPAQGVPLAATALVITELDPLTVPLPPPGRQFLSTFEITLEDGTGTPVPPDRPPDVGGGPGNTGGLGGPPMSNLRIMHHDGTQWVDIQDLSSHELDRRLWGTTPGFSRFAIAEVVPTTTPPPPAAGETTPSPVGSGGKGGGCLFFGIVAPASWPGLMGSLLALAWLARRRRR